jgi:hypothetical protein
MDPPELASEPPRSRIELRAAFKTIGLGNVRAALTWPLPIIATNHASPSLL